MPFAELGLKQDEYDRIRGDPGRRPTSSELAIYSVMWSEHCSYKSSKVHLRQFGDKAPQVRGAAGRHGRERRGRRHRRRLRRSPSRSSRTTTRPTSSPTRARPPGSAGSSATSSSMGARPVAVMDSLRFGAARPGRGPAGCCRAWWTGIGGYGNCLGLPNIGGEVVLRPGYIGNPLVNALLRRPAAARTRSSWPPPPGPATRWCCSAPAPARGRHRRRLGPGRRRPSTTSSRPSGPPCRSATRSWRSC